MTFDHGELNIPNRLRGLDAQIVREVDAARRAAIAEAKTAARDRRAIEASRQWFTAADLAGADVVRVAALGWRVVVSVNAESVTVSDRDIAGNRTTYRVGFKSILEHRRRGDS